MKILFIGDIVGKIGRRAVAQVLPEWKKEHNPDFVLSNAENAAHGIGITVSTFDDIRKSGIDFFTSGNHWADKSDGVVLYEDSSIPLIRPANWDGKVAGRGYAVIEVGATKVAIINLMGQVFMGNKTTSPFRALDEVLAEIGRAKPSIIIVDFHAEATSEKAALARYADGRVSAVIGTHTHIPTADECVLPGGAAFVTDAGMVGAWDSIIGVQKDEVLANFFDHMKRPHVIPESGTAVVNAVLMEIDKKDGKAKSIKRLDAEVRV